MHNDSDAPISPERAMRPGIDIPTQPAHHRPAHGGYPDVAGNPALASHLYGDGEETTVRIDRARYPEIIQAARWIDDDNGTPHFEPGVGFIVDDPDGLTVPNRWLPHLDRIEAALATAIRAALKHKGSGE